MNQPRRQWLFFVPLLIGVGLFVVLKQSNQGAQQEQASERATAVRVISPPVVEVAPRVLAYGSVEPASVLEAVAEVAGELVLVHAKLSPGELVREGEVLLRIDPVDYELNLVQAEAQLTSSNIRLAELDVQEKNLNSLLALDQQALKISERELNRLSGLLSKGTVTRSAYDKEQQNTISRRQSVQGRKNSLAELPSSRSLQKAEIARLESLLSQAKRNLERTEIVAPFTGRVSSASLEVGEYVRAGDRLLELDAIDRAEVSVQLPMHQMATLILPSDDQQTGMAPPETLINAQVLMDLGGKEQVWPARVSRLSDQVDPKTRTVGVIVTVDGPYENVQAGVKPPLVKGMFVKVMLQAKQGRRMAVVPRDAMTDGQLLVLNDENRLEKLEVLSMVASDGYVGIKYLDGSVEQSGLQVIVSDLVPAIDGMLLRPVVDEAAVAALLDMTGARVEP